MSFLVSSIDKVQNLEIHIQHHVNKSLFVSSFLSAVLFSCILHNCRNCSCSKSRIK